MILTKKGKKVVEKEIDPIIKAESSYSGGSVEQVLYGVFDSLQPAIGYNYGAAKFERVRAIEKYCLITFFIFV